MLVSDVVVPVASDVIELLMCVDIVTSVKGEVDELLLYDGVEVEELSNLSDIVDPCEFVVSALIVTELCDGSSLPEVIVVDLLSLLVDNHEKLSVFPV